MFKFFNNSRTAFRLTELKLSRDLLPIVFPSSRHDAKPLLPA